jgi:hypothetical protein
MSRLTLWALVLGLLASGCSSGRRSRFALDAARLTRARELAAEQRAPELFAHAEAARSAADKAPEGSPARSDYASEARLWLEAAIAESARVELSEKRLASERELVAAETELTRVERERSEVTREVEAKLAANIASEEAQRALERASLATKLRPKLSPAEVSEAAEALLARAALVQAALSTLALDAAKQAALSAEREAARALLAKDPDAALDKARAALDHTLVLLGALRKKEAKPSAAEAGALAEALHEAGLSVTRGDRGLAGVLPAAFVERTLKPAARAGLVRVCALAKAFPHGGVRAAVSSKSSALARVRKNEVQSELRRAGCDPGRVGVDAVSMSGDDVEISWLAY